MLPSGLYGLVPLIIILPVVGLLINLIFGARMNEKAVGAIASVASGLAFVVSLLLGVALWMGSGEAVTVPFADWIHIGDLNVPWAFRVDTLSVTMMLVVSGVGTLIHIYAIGYMHEDVRNKNDLGRFQRFFVYLSLFIALMMLLVSGNSYLMMFVGWEGVTLCSYLLVGFWYEMDILGRPSIANALAGKKAMIANRIGDFGFLLAAFTMFWAFKSLSFDTIFAHAAQVKPGVILAITLFLLIGVTSKSAQLPLYVWLPDAMAGPTPVSALIHAATMVTAGVYLVTRSAPLFNVVPAAQTTVAMVGGITAFFGATIAVGQYDIKKVLVYSTISQLGYMVAAVGMGAYVAGIFHLVTHAFFKGLLFLAAGSVILGMERGHHHLSNDEHGKEGETTFNPNDMRNMGGLRKQMPTTFWVYLVGTLALVGIAPWSGFWSKDEILAAMIHRFPAVFCLLAAAAFFTAFYMGRQIWMVFLGEPRHAAARHAEESPKIILFPLIILAALATLGGALNLPIQGMHFLTDWLGHTIAGVEAGNFNFLIAALSTGLALLAIVLSWVLYGRKPLDAGQMDPLQHLLGPVFTIFERKYWVDEVYTVVIINRYVDIARFLADVIDVRFLHDWFHDKVIVGTYQWLARIVLSRGIDEHGIDAFFNGLGKLTRRVSASLRRVQNGFVRSYALVMLVGVVIMIGYLIFRSRG
jgi:NADH-quinone oxidoreductase subunit L